MRDLLRLLQRIRITLLFAVLLLASLVLVHNGNAHHRARAIGSSNAVVGTVLAWRHAVSEYTGLRQENERLLAENADLRNRHVSFYAPAEHRLVRINDTIHRQVYRVMPARVVNGTVHKQRNHFTLDKGAHAGVDADMGVIGSEGIVGVVRHVSPHFASVITVLNPDIRVGVRVERTGHLGLLFWDTQDPATASVLDIAKDARVRVGDAIVTRGGDGIFPAGVPVGRVIDVQDDPGNIYHDIRIALGEDLRSAVNVYVVSDLMRAERDSLEQRHTNEP
jgi:rod shape-determining protein MreC